ncbi:type I polyketide synthase [Actinophytocola sediminis]
MSTTGLEIAVVGLSCRLPGAPDALRYWRNLCDGTESITVFARDRLAAAGVPDALLDNPGYVPAHGVLAGFDQFDAEFFGVSPREAALMDPQHRVLLECAWEALEDAGFDRTAVPGQVGVFAGSYYNSYLENLTGHVDRDDPGAAFALNIANEKDYLAARIAYKLDLHGAAVTVQTACSTSLVAVHLACQALLSGSCDMALAGGVTVRAKQVGYLFEPGGIFSPDGHCRPFDAAAKGTVPANGVGVVALRRLEDAVADGDPIRAVIKGSAIGNDGAERVGFTAPGATGQSRIIRAALDMAEVDPATVTYVEAHGSGTPVGDPIEVLALTRAYRGVAPGRCAIGSVKGNIGHTHAAAGVAGLIKVVLALQHRLLPASLHYDTANSDIDFHATPFSVNTGLTRWCTDGSPLRAGVSSFGMGGTGAHVIVEEAPARDGGSPGRGHQVLPVSARSETAVEAAVGKLATCLTARPDLPVGSVARTLQSGRRQFAHRRFVVADTSASAAQALRERNRHRLRTGHASGPPPRVAFMFPGLGEQRVGMGRELYANDPVFRTEIDRCADGLRPYLDVDLPTMLYPPEDTSGGFGEHANGRQKVAGGLGERADLDRTRYAQPAMFTIEYALARLWQSWGVRPDAMLGYSIGEYVAACLSGVFTLEDALRLVVRRGELIDRLPAGAMLAVPRAESYVQELLGDGLSITAVNGPDMSVVGGEVERIADLERRLADRHIATRRIRTTHAFHSHMMDSITAEFAELVASTTRNPPHSPYVSTVTGDWITAGQAQDPNFWATHLRRPVRFGDAVSRLRQEPGRLLLEVGPGRALSGLVSRAGGRRAADVHSSLPGEYNRYSEEEFLVTTAGKLWAAGVDLEWSTVRGGKAAKISLPTYPFERRRHWLQPATNPAERDVPPARRADIADRFHVPVWEPLAPHTAPMFRHVPELSWLVFLDERGVGVGIVRRLREAGHHVTTVRAGLDWRRDSERSFEMAPGNDEHYRRLMAEAGLPDRIVHLWNIGTPAALEQMLERGFASLLRLNQVVASLPLDLAIVTNEAYAVLGTEDGAPEQTTSAGACLVLPLEQPETSCRVVDISVAHMDSDQLLAELLRPSGHPFTALRGRRRWFRTYRPVRLDTRTEPRMGGTYLITGGFGGIGLTLAKHLAREAKARLVLVSRAELPPRDTWDHEPPTGPHAGRVRAVRELEELGAEVMAVSADVTDLGRMTEIADDTVARFGAVHGIVHAAGVAADGLAQLKDVASALRVLAPKVRGGLVMDTLARRLRPQFTMYCSSTLAITGGVGQIDYVAANAFLDALAARNDVSGGPRTISVNWDAWQEVGMAARTVDGVPPARVDHPLLAECLVDGETAVYSVSLAAHGWLVDEHRIAGRAVLPGTGHLELVRAAYEHHSGGRGVGLELRDVTFLSPLVMADDQRRELRVILEGDQFSVVSRYHGDTDEWLVHVTGEIGPTEATPEPYDLTALVSEHGMQDTDAVVHAGPMSFGPRFDCVRKVRVGTAGAVAELELPAQFAAELEHLRLHPSLMDNAMGFYGIQFAREFRVPVSYGRLVLLAPLPRRIVSHHRFREPDQQGKEIFSSDVVVTDERGMMVASVENFVLKRATDVDSQLAALCAGTLTGTVTRRLPRQGRQDRPSPLREHIAEGIRPDEGVDAFTRVIASNIGPNVAVATKDLGAVAAEVVSHSQAMLAVPGAPVRAEPGPDGLSTDEASADDLERALVRQWADLLGLDSLGVEDDLFELGAHSLLGLQFVGRIRRSLGVDLPLAMLFEASTVRELAAVLRPQLQR